MKGQPVDQLVFEQVFAPKGPRSGDSHNFQTLHRHLVIEVRQEVHSFYGHLDTQEAKYPGLDYTSPIHRIRLSRWPWHRRLFRAFDALQLTKAEIHNLTKWEGTLWAKERFEREQGIVIHDSAMDEIPRFVPPELRRTVHKFLKRGAENGDSKSELDDDQDNESADDHISVDEEEDDSVLASVGESLNQRLVERVTIRNEHNDATISLDSEWETWFKDAIESGQLSGMPEDIRQRVHPSTSRPSPHHVAPDDLWPPRILAAARAGRWSSIPESLHTMIRQSLENEAQRREIHTTTAFTNSYSASTQGPHSTPGSSQLPPSGRRRELDTTVDANGHSASTRRPTTITGSGPPPPSYRYMPSVHFVRTMAEDSDGSRAMANLMSNHRQQHQRSDTRMQPTQTQGRLTLPAPSRTLDDEIRDLEEGTRELHFRIQALSEHERFLIQQRRDLERNDRELGAERQSLSVRIAAQSAPTADDLGRAEAAAMTAVAAAAATVPRMQQTAQPGA